MEGPVIWPTWCYSGDASAVREAANNAERTMPSGRYRRKAQAHETTLVDLHHFAAHYNTDSVNNNNNNNNSLKFERLSPGTTDTSSRSATPSSSLSNPNTPPADTSSLQLTCRNYSEFMRNLASKYQSTASTDFLPLAHYPRAKSATAPTFLPVFHPGGGGGGGCVKDEPTRTPPMVLNPFSNAILPPLIDMSTTQVLLAMLRTAKDAEVKGLLKHVKHAEACSPLDLSAAAPPPSKRTRTTTTPMSSPHPDIAHLPDAHCQHALDREDVFSWSVEEVCSFVASIDTCEEYVPNFKAERIDGSSLPLLTEEHLTTVIQMKLGPALKLRATLAKRMCSCNICMHCIHCHSQIASPVAAAAAAETGSSQHAESTTSHSSADLKHEHS